MEVPTAASDRGLEIVIDIKKDYVVFEPMGETPSRLSLIFPLPVEESDPDSLVLYVNQ